MTCLCLCLQPRTASSSGTKDLIESYVDEVVCQLNYLATNEVEGLTAAQKLEIFVQLRGAYGQSALLLSGGAGLGIHHFGVIKALHEAELLPRIISGSSAGALIGALVCVTPASELKAMLSSCTSGFNAFAREGEAETTSAQKLAQFLQSGSIADVQVLKECARSNLGDLTFQEQYVTAAKLGNPSSFVPAENLLEDTAWVGCSPSPGPAAFAFC